MPCYSPLKAFRNDDGSVSFVEGGHNLASLTLPCGRCIGCRLERSRQWAVRCVHEASLYQDNCFLTLTYNDEHLPEYNSLQYRDVQLFLKRLRKLISPRKVRFFVGGEYGSNTKRPHYHLLLFNYNFQDLKYHTKSDAGFKLYTSEVLSKLWSDRRGDVIGHSSVGALTFDSAAYTARYIVDKHLGRDAESHYEVANVNTGEVFQRVPEFARMSLKPGIGSEWFEKWSKDVFPHDFVVVNGIRCKPPRFYQKKYRDKIDPLVYDEVVIKRLVEADKRSDDNTPDRLAVKEQVKMAQINNLRRDKI